MRRHILRTVIATILFIGITAQAHADVKVVATIKPVHSILASLMKGVGTPTLLIEDQTPLTYTPDSKTLKTLDEADLVVWVGRELETSLAKLLTGKDKAFELLSYPELKILPLRGAPETSDPFIWLDVRNSEVMIDALYGRLVGIAPAQEKTFAANRKALKQEIAGLDRVFEYGFRAVAAGQSWLYHDTHQYFEQSYAFKVRGILSNAPGADADMANMLKARTTLSQMGKVCFFLEEGMSDKNLSFALDGTKAKVATLKSFGLSFAPGPDLYVKMMRYNFDTIAKCFSDIDAHYVEPTNRKMPE